MKLPEFLEIVKALPQAVAEAATAESRAKVCINLQEVSALHRAVKANVLVVFCANLRCKDKCILWPCLFRFHPPQLVQGSSILTSVVSKCC